MSEDSADTNPHPLADYRSNEEWQDLVAQTGSLLAALDNIKDEDAKAQVFAALEGIDSVHREALHRLVKLFNCLLYTSPSPRDLSTSRMPSSA